VSTHLIVGLGEAEEEMIERIAACHNHNISVGLFAFTPVRGTTREGKLPPDIGHYRRIQIAHYLLKQGYSQTVFQYHNGILSGIDLPCCDLETVLASGKAFETSGCEGCNRPYYNERPGGIMYNYPRPLTLPEVRQALKESGIIEMSTGMRAAITDKSNNQVRRSLS
jgi:biotin synthase